MRRHWILYLAVAPMLVQVLSRCTGASDESPQDVQSDSGDAASMIECPDSLVLWPKYDVCAPRVDECEAWEVPVIGGGCMAVGPRACPKLWDPDADVDCEPGELMDYDGAPCPEGFVLTEDEVACIPFFEEDGVCGELEIPVLGGGCQRVGPEWGDEGEPFFDECVEGFLARPGGGCVMIGPRGCPKVWDPDAEVDCEVGDILPCPEGWMESDDGMYCYPGWDECSHGEVPLAGGGCERLLPLAEDCPAGPFPEMPEGATDVIYVLSDSTCMEGCGSETSPFAAIQAAIDAAPAGAVVLVGPGNYPEGLSITKPVQVIGLCAALVEVSGTALVVPDGDSKLLEAGVGIYDTQGVTLSGLSVRSPAPGVAVVAATDIAFDGIDIGESHGVALYVDGGAYVEADDLWIHDTELGSGEMGYGRGAWVGGESELGTRGMLVEEVRRCGVRATGDGTRVALFESVVRKTKPSDSVAGGEGLGLEASDSSTVSLTDSLFEENQMAGLQARHSGTEVTVTGSVIRGTNSNENGRFGWGIRADLGCRVQVTDSLLEETSEFGVGVLRSGTEVTVSRSVIRRTASNIDGEHGWGLGADLGCKVSVTGSLLEENRERGIQVFSPGTDVTVSGTLIRDTFPSDGIGLGSGIDAGAGSKVSISDCLLEENGFVSVVAIDSGTDVAISDSVIRNTASDEYGEYGWGLGADLGSTVSVTGSLLEENREAGIQSISSDTEVAVSGTVIRTTLPSQGGGLGMGLRAGGGTKVSISGSMFDENTSAGIQASGSGTEVVVSGAVIRETGTSENEGAGDGLLCDWGASVFLFDSLLEDNNGIGLTVFHSGTEVTVSGTGVRNTCPTEGGVLGYGIQASDGCTVLVSGSLLEGNRNVGLVVLHPGTEAVVSGSMIQSTLPPEFGEAGGGIHASDGSTVSLTDSLMKENGFVSLAVFDSGTEAMISNTVIRDTTWDADGGEGLMAGLGCTVSIENSLLDENKGTGLLMWHPDTDVAVTGTVIRNTLPDMNWTRGSGIQASDGCTVSVIRSFLEGNTMVGIGGRDSGTEVTVSGSVIRNTHPDGDGKTGMGLIMERGSSGTISESRIEGNETAGVFVSGQGVGGVPSMLLVEDCAILETRTSVVETLLGDNVFGDGAVAANGGILSLESLVLAGNDRAGIYYHDSSGEVADSILWANASYGLVMHNCSEFVEYSDGTDYVRGENDNYIFGNAHSLPANAATQICTTPNGLPVPDVPNWGIGPAPE